MRSSPLQNVISRKFPCIAFVPTPRSIQMQRGSQIHVFKSVDFLDFAAPAKEVSHVSAIYSCYLLALEAFGNALFYSITRGRP